MERNDLGQVLAVSAADIDAMDWVDDPTRAGVRHKVLWQSGATVLGLMMIDAGAVNPEHTHHGAHHHILMLSGTATMLGRGGQQGPTCTSHRAFPTRPPTPRTNRAPSSTPIGGRGPAG